MTCTKKAIRAHSLQNARVFDLLSHDGHVIGFRMRIYENAPKINFDSVGRNEASTFTGFCSEHDEILFAPIDKLIFDPANRQQLFLLAYRAVTFELHAVMEGAVKIQSLYQTRIEEGFDPAGEQSPAGILATQALLKSFFTYQYRVDFFDSALVKGNYSDIEHDVLIFEGQIPAIAVSSLFSLDEMEREDDVVRVVLNVVPVSANQTVAIFSYARPDIGLARATLDRILNASGEYQKYELSKLILRRISNFFIARIIFGRGQNKKRKS